MRKAIGIFVATAVLITLSWAWRGLPVAMRADALPAGAKLPCVSYAPFRGSQTPLDPTTVIPPEQIEQDLAKLSRLTSCVRIYSVDMGLDRVPEIAARHNLQVLLGIWISREARRNQEQVAAGVAIANRHPDTVRAIIVGNEVLLRGEQSVEGLAAIIAAVRSQTKVPVTYADVWEFWLQNRQLAAGVDFVTVHILPYWEDIPIPAHAAADHTAEIRQRVARAFPGKDILIGEAGWPSQGRMREGARPSPIAQAQVLHDLLARARAENFKINLIEALDQPWKRHLEGTVGGYWGLLDNDRAEKFAWGQPVSNVPLWPWQAVAGLGMAALVFGLGLAGAARPLHRLPLETVVALGLVAGSAGCFAGDAVQAAMTEALGWIGGMRSLMQALIAVGVPMIAAAALGRGAALPSLVEVIGPQELRRRDGLSRLLGLCVIVTCLVAIESALGLVFNARYLDFPYAALTSAILPLLVLSVRFGTRPAKPRVAEAVIAAILLPSAVKVVWAETLANWQAVWVCAAFLLLAFTLVRASLARN